MTASIDRGPDVSDEGQALTLERLLSERLLRESPVLFGEEHIGAVIRWCAPWSEVTGTRHRLDDLAILAHPGDVSVAMLGELSERGAAALLVRGPLPERPETGHALPFAVLMIEPETDYVAVSELIGRLSLAFESHVLNYGLAVHRQLADLLHRGAGLEAICYRMARLSSCSVAVFEQDLRILAFDHGPNAWINPSAFGHAMRELDADLQVVSDSHPVPETAALDIGSRSLMSVYIPILLGARQYGWVAIADANDPPHVHDMAEHRILVEQAAPIIGTEILRLRSVEAAEERARGSFVHALLHGRFTNRSDLIGRAEHHEFSVDGRYGVVVAHGRGLIAEEDSPAKLAQMARQARVLLAQNEKQTLATVVGDVLAVVRELPKAPRAGADRGLTELRHYALGLEAQLSPRSDQSVEVTYGRPVQGAELIEDSYREARLALGLRARLGIDQVCGFTDLRVYATLLDVASAQTGIAYAEETLRPLRDARSGDLEAAVRTYVESGGNVNESARRFGVHRNTMLYKVDRASSLLQRDLRDSEHRFALWLAMKLETLSTVTREVDRDLVSR